MVNLLEAVAIALALTHFGLPLAYYYYVKKRWLPKPWGIRLDEDYRPKVSVIVPTYNEANNIVERLDNIYSQDYPKELLEVVVVDSGSTDGTPELVKKCVREHNDLRVELLEEPIRVGKAHALNTALGEASGDIVVIADAFWDENVLRNAVKYLSDHSVGAVSCIKSPTNRDVTGFEDAYRTYYNIVRIAESKAWSTPIFHGELAAFKRELIEKVRGFPVDIGADDSHTATMIALMGYRAIIPEDVLVIERVPRKGYTMWRVRRAQHLIQHFTKTLNYRQKTPKQFKAVLYIETFLHLVNPWLLLVAASLLLVSLVLESPMALTLLVLGLFPPTLIKSYRMWVAAQLYLAMAAVRGTYNK
ncbi:MAG: glycosyltransferase family 2 protein, partial [Sulfolobales archaeon]|nr:glycosyltransferase family 2 protein [Sulfolobales archaeon]